MCVRLEGAVGAFAASGFRKRNTAKEQMRVAPVVNASQRAHVHRSVGPPDFVERIQCLRRCEAAQRPPGHWPDPVGPDPARTAPRPVHRATTGRVLEGNCARERCSTPKSPVVLLIAFAPQRFEYPNEGNSRRHARPDEHAQSDQPNLTPYSRRRHYNSFECPLAQRALFGRTKCILAGGSCRGNTVCERHWAAALAAGSLFLGVGLGIAASQHGGGIDVIRGKSAKDAGDGRAGRGRAAGRQGQLGADFRRSRLLPIGRQGARTGAVSIALPAQSPRAVTGSVSAKSTRRRARRIAQSTAFKRRWRTIRRTTPAKPRSALGTSASGNGTRAKSCSDRLWLEHPMKSGITFAPQRPCWVSPQGARASSGIARNKALE